jgi:hypothetical protein
MSDDVEVGIVTDRHHRHRLSTWLIWPGPEQRIPRDVRLLVRQLRHQGVALTPLSDGVLAVQAPRSWMTSERLVLLAERTAALASHLRRGLP